MNRPIKFRAFAEGKMYEVDELSWKNGVPDSLLLIGGDGRFSIEEVTLMQFTGLLDKNGKEIYEKDIIRHPNGQVVPVAVYNYASGSSTGHDYFISGYQYTLEDEIIGNSHENPELLKAK